MQLRCLQGNGPISVAHGFLACVLYVGKDSFDREVGGGVDRAQDLLDRVMDLRVAQIFPANVLKRGVALGLIPSRFRRCGRIEGKGVGAVGLDECFLLVRQALEPFSLDRHR